MSAASQSATVSLVRGSSTINRRGSASGNARRKCSIVGVGASAGGLEAFLQLLKHLPRDTGFGFVLVQHLDPKHESALTQLLKPATAMPVREVTNNLRVEANHVYVIPPNASLGIAHGILKLQPRSPERVAPRAIDFFFEALAKDKRERAIGVILSGTASDGTLGLEAIKAEGGLTFAQDGSARYDSMPRHAIVAGCVDLVLSPEKIARELARIARHPYVADHSPGFFALLQEKNGSPANGASAAAAPRSQLTRNGKERRGTFRIPIAGGVSAAQVEENSYQKILLLLRNHCGVDFSLYKSSTIHRRVARRAVLSRSETVGSYAGFLRRNPKELDALYADALISVTSFFRNAEAFEVLKRKVFARLLQERGDEPVRVWVLGCSTGQEAYSLAMAFTEAADRFPRARNLQVFATDLNEANLVKARRGFYPTSLVQDVSPERLRRFFVEEKSGYQVIKPLRERVVFARQNLISDPPFSRMDLISCRNVMIYLEPTLQKKALPAFHYALKPEGVLFLGASESVGTFTDLFSPVDKKQKIFAKKTAPTLAFQLPIKDHRSAQPLRGRVPRSAKLGGSEQGGASDVFRGELNAEREADRVTINQFAPPGVLINAEFQIVQFRGPTDAYLKPPTGKARFDLLTMAREGLMLPLRTVINRAKKENRNARLDNVPMKLHGRNQVVDVAVVPLKNLKERRFLVLFADPANRRGILPAELNEAPTTSGRVTSKKEQSSRIAGLERDLAETRDYLQSFQEHQDAANEELQVSNEEGQSANEELQSLNEELETSKEELESTNEELTTVNEEMAGRNAELTTLNSDLTNLQTSTRLVIVLLGRDLTIRRFSPQAEKQFNLHASDVGRPVGGVAHNLDLSDLGAFVAGVIRSVRECEREVRDKEGRWYSLRVRPYLNAAQRVDGAVLVLMDIDVLKRTEARLSEEHEHTEAIIQTVPNPLVTLSADLHVRSANEAFYRTFQLTPAETTGRSIYTLDHAAWDLPRLRRLLKEIIPRNRSFDDFEVIHDSERLGRRALLLNARVLLEPGGKPKKILLGIRDVTERQLAEDALRASEERFRVLFDLGPLAVYSCDRSGTIRDFNRGAVKLWGRKPNLMDRSERFCGSFKLYRANGTFMPHQKCPMVDVLNGKVDSVHDAEVVVERPDGSRITCIVNIVPLKDAGGKITGAINCFYEISDRKRAEEALRVARVSLVEHASHLEELVTRRTAQLTAANKRLEASVHSNRKGKEQYRVLFLESQAMEKKLRHVARLIIAAQEEERKEISRELHDEVVQTLVGINVELSALSAGAAEGLRAMKEKIGHTQRLVENSVQAVHRFARGLRPAVLDDLGLIPALHAYSKSLAARKKIKIDLTADRRVEQLDSAKRTVLFRVAQEALTNVARHARATHVDFVISRIPGAIRMEIRDDGQSFPVKKTLLTGNNKRLGLIGMRERVEMVGGRLLIESTPRKGTSVSAEIPFKGKK